jgi:TolB-like protein
VAVMPLKYLGDDARFAPLGKGLSEMLMTDLSQVPGLKPVERIRVQALMDEINLGQTGLIDESSAAKFGKMVGAGKMIHGDFNISGNSLNLDVTYADMIKDRFSDPITLRDAVRQMFLLQKDMAFKIIGEMGVELTPEERAAIQRIPTNNLQAFMAYSMGLEMEDRGQYDKAATYFEQAVTLDPAFDLANRKVEESRTLVAATQPLVPRSGINIDTRTPESAQRPTDHAAQADAQPVVRQQEPGTARQFSQQEMLANRLQTVNQNMGSVLIPGTDSRKPTEEAAVADSEPILEDLPLPPDMPDSGQLP